jgi:hypothetical protein
MKIILLILIASSFLMGQNNVTSPHGPKLKLACETCHTTADWKDVPRYKFNHDQVGFPLVGEHKFAECSSCHKSLVFNHVGIACADCHTDFHKGELGVQCETCHSSQNWENRQHVFDQHNQTNFPLIGVHANLDCESCHTNEQGRQFANLSVECQSCHLVDYMATLSPSHHESGFNLDCQKCHLPNATVWERAIFNHPDTFPLKDGHFGLDCADCHSNGVGGTNTDCYSCHRKDYEKTTEPDHLTFGFPTDCQQCHTGVSWERSSFDHFTESGFRIEGTHQSVLCIDCHENNQLSGIPRDCVGCHREDFNTVTDPNHVTNSFRLECESCHNQNRWTPAEFDHNKTDFALTGGHVSLDCVDCHSGGYNNTSTDCYTCHQANFTSVEEPNHVTNNFDHDCTTCHNTSTWSPANFDHASTSFPLVGAHTSVDCADCHTTGYTQQLPSDCWSCHESNYKAVEDPNHVSNNFDHDCTTCHSSTAWSPANFDHANTSFTLVGAHTSVDCADCHTTGYTQQLPTDCWSCHESNYKAVEDPNHVSNNFDHDCTTCHSSTVWSPANFDHASTSFPLVGAHTSVDCADCHTTGYTQQLPSDCWSCHESNYKAVNDPNHVSNNFDHDCTTCHSSSAWTPATFDHATTDFPLTGAHSTADCASCHSTGYQNTPLECWSCHESVYNQTTDPNHKGANFPTTCENCHTTTAWTPADWDHDKQYFPIYSGKHKDEWNACADCHINTNNYAQFECITCHEHNNKSEVDNDHKDVSGYSYDSQACFTCHPTGDD